MNTKTTITPIDNERYCHKVPFRVKGYEKLIATIQQKGVLVKFDSNRSHACACFDNTQDFNDFKKQLLRFPVAETN